MINDAHWNYTAFQLHRIKNSNLNDYDEFLVHIGGSSTGVEAITTDQAMAEKLSERTGKKIGYASVVASYGDVLDYEKIIRYLKNDRITFVVGLEPYLFTRDISQATEFYSEKQKRRIVEYYYLPVPFSSILLVNSLGYKLSFFEGFVTEKNLFSLGETVQTITKKAIAGRGLVGKYDRHRTSRKAKPATEKKLTKFIKSNKKAAEEYKKISGIQFVLLEKIAKFCSDNSMKLLFFELPAPDYLYPSLESGYAQYYSDIVNFSKKYDIPYQEFQDNYWPANYYRDRRHLKEEGRLQFEDLLVSYLANNIK